MTKRARLPVQRRVPHRVTIAGLLLALIALLAIACSESNSGPDSDSLILQAENQATPSPATVRDSGATATPANTKRRVTLAPLGQIDPGDDGFHADVWEHKGF